jgi:hypothetical protein
MDGRTDGRMDGRTDGRTDGRMDGRTDGRTDLSNLIGAFRHFAKESINAYIRFWNRYGDTGEESFKE